MQVERKLRRTVRIVVSGVMNCDLADIFSVLSGMFQNFSMFLFNKVCDSVTEGAVRLISLQSFDVFQMFKNRYAMDFEKIDSLKIECHRCSVGCIKRRRKLV